MYSERKTEIDGREIKKKKTSAWSVGGSIEQQVNYVCTGQWQRVGLVSQGAKSDGNEHVVLCVLSFTTCRPQQRRL